MIVAIDETGSCANPFDSWEIRVDGHFRGPEGKEVVMPAFFDQDCRRQLTIGGATRG
ncbi:MAG: DUF5060 domain-containing protein [Rhodopirellula sp.]|nr:DUF5060 domain-containing protein [Rhodopirellula sp.]